MPIQIKLNQGVKKFYLYYFKYLLNISSIHPAPDQAMDDDWEAKVGSTGKHGVGGQEEDQHWSQSSFKRFDWDEGVEDVWSSADTSR